MPVVELCCPKTAHVWHWFDELNSVVGLGWGPYVLPFSEIEAYGRSRGVTIKHWEALLIRDLCLEFMIARDKNKLPVGAPANPKSPAISKVTPMSDGAGLLSLFKGMGSTIVKRKPENGPSAHRPEG